MNFAALSRVVGRGRDGDVDPYANLAWLRAHATVAQVPGPGGRGFTWFVTNEAEARACLTDARLSFDPANSAAPRAIPGEPGYVFARDAPEHTRLRALVRSPFARRAVRALRPEIEQVCHNLIDAFADRAAVDLLSEYTLPLAESVTYRVFGLPPDRQLRVGHGTHLTVLADFLEQSAAGAATRELHEFARSALAYKRTARGPDVTSALLDSRARGDIVDDAEMEGLFYVVFTTSLLTSAPFIAGAVLRVLQRPTLVSDLRDGRRQWREVVEESLRYDSTVQTTMPRFALEDLELGGERIAKGDAVTISLAAANRDPVWITRADEYLPERASQAHLAFGDGAHFCLGAHLVRTEAEIGLRILFQRIPQLRLAVDAAEIPWVLGPMLRSPREVPVVVNP